MTWEKVARIIDRVYGNVNWDERFYICPQCDEPIYEEDYPFMLLNEAGDVHCPICEEVL